MTPRCPCGAPATHTYPGQDAMPGVEAREDVRVCAECSFDVVYLPSDDMLSVVDFVP